MGVFTKRPVLLGFLVGLFLLVLCIFVPVPMYDGIFHYDHKLVHIETDGKVALSYYFAIGLERVRTNGILPSKIELKPIGYALFILIHIGLPALLTIRFRMSNARRKIESSSDE